KLSIIDASILPVCPSTHITSTMYAVAEKPHKVLATPSGVMWVDGQTGRMLASMMDNFFVPYTSKS
ncbi:6134_t:CDS:2, partial [Acaulospora colombiana]